MAENESDQDDKTEDATPERREDFREKGQIAHSQELSQVATLAAIVILFFWYGGQVTLSLRKLFVVTFESISTFRIDQKSVIPYFSSIWIDLIVIIAPIFLVAAVISILVTLLQTQFSWSWQKLAFEWSKLNPITGITRILGAEMLVGMLRTTAKLTVVTLTTWLVLAGEWTKVTGLIYVPLVKTWLYWGDITTQLVWGVVGLMLFVAVADYIYTFVSLEKKMRMTKQEVKDELKQRETDPHVKARIRRMAREIANRKTIENTKKATVLITNPTHYSIAVRYEIGMPAPFVVAKGVDFLALKMRETARELDIPIIENKPLARALYAAVDEGSEIPGDMYKAVAEIIKFVFKLKNVRIPGQSEKKIATTNLDSNESNL